MATKIRKVKKVNEINERIAVLKSVEQNDITKAQIEMLEWVIGK